MHEFLGWAKSPLGTPINLFSSHSLAKLKTLRPLLWLGGVHGDEPLGVELATQTLAWLKTVDSINTVPWLLIPILNVDGIHNNTRVNARGVDLNRNYPAKSWSPDFAKERYFPGPTAGSEPEVQAVVSLITEFRPRLIVHCHSWKPMIVCAGEPGLKDAQRLAQSSGYPVVPEIGYPTPGSLSQFGWIDHRIPVICIEEADETPTEKVWPNFQDGIKEVFLDASDR